MTTTPDKKSSEVELVVLTGLSGAGRSEGANALEDLGWFVIDNLPPALIRTMLELALAPGNDIRRIALVIDARGGAFFYEADEELAKVRAEIPNCRLVFFEAADDALLRRFDASRRTHPLAADDTVEAGIQRERELMQPLRDQADLIIDTSNLSVHELRAKMAGNFGNVGSTRALSTTVISFGYKHGVPLDADIVLDCRFLPNPHWVQDLRPLSGMDPPVRDYVLGNDLTQEFLTKTRDLLTTLMPGYRNEGRHYLTIAVGCTGGRHRSVVLADEVGAAITEQGFPVKVIHRDVRRGGAT